ncbi:hypothetical protein FACS1894199_14640 [Bacteroidia bacterium]|nr:hypothetical protein FACS1894199_14640 [Bacteroidia bacterium]
MYKVFFKGSYFLLTDLLPNRENPIGSYSKSHEYRTKKKLGNFVFSLLDSAQSFQAVIFAADVEFLLVTFCRLFLNFQAAGGVVLNQGHVLVIKRFGLYDLPKGHLEKDEAVDECALREVEEECGIKGLRLGRPLTPTFHIYYLNREPCLKTTHWFAMECPDGQTPMPQTDEGIDEALWLDVREIPTILHQTYDSLRVIWEMIK